MPSPVSRQPPPGSLAAHPLRFPESEPETEKSGESSRHLVLRTALWQLIQLGLVAGPHTVGSEQFVYFNARDPRRCCAADVYVKLGLHVADVATWKVWEHGAPDLAVEITSPSDRERWTWEDKLERYHELGVRELVRFDPDAPRGQRLAVWNRIDEDLVEREVEGDACACATLGLYWHVRPVGSYQIGLRLSRDAAGLHLLPTPEERIAELEAELRRTAK
ncbi:MAG: Uma2 family endonuclease [Polyangiaceae bacterium]